MISVRNILIGLAVAFTAYLAVRGLWWTEPVPHPYVVVATLGLFLVTTWLCVFWEPEGGAPAAPTNPADPTAISARGTTTRLPLWGAVLALACAAIIPSAVAYGVGQDARTASFATWYLGGIGALMTIVMVRGRPWVAWGGIALLAVASMVWMQPLPALALGLVGAFLWVGVTQLLLGALDRAARDTAQLTELQRAASGWQAAQVVRQRERRVQIQRALTIAGPTLTRTVAAAGALSAEDRVEARLAEGRLRDELRAPGLLDDEVRDALERARRRGAHVTVLDEGGLEGLDDAALTVVRAELAETLRVAQSDRLIIRTSPHETVAVTVVGRSPASDRGSQHHPSDEDAVDLWREIARPTR